MKAIFYTLLLGILSISCVEPIVYPNYSLGKISYIPDSLKTKHREFVKETVRAASQHMTGGDYEDVDETIIQAKHTADDLFQVTEIGLIKHVNENYWDDIEIRIQDMDPYEKEIYNQLNKN